MGRNVLEILIVILDLFVRIRDALRSLTHVTRPLVALGQFVPSTVLETLFADVSLVLFQNRTLSLDVDQNVSGIRIVRRDSSVRISGALKSPTPVIHLLVDQALCAWLISLATQSVDAWESLFQSQTQLPAVGPSVQEILTVRQALFVKIKCALKLQIHVTPTRVDQVLSALPMEQAGSPAVVPQDLLAMHE